MHHFTVADRAFAVAVPPNKLSSLNNFEKHLKFHLFKISLAKHDSFDVKRLRQLVMLAALYKLPTLLTYFFRMSA